MAKVNDTNKKGEGEVIVAGGVMIMAPSDDGSTSVNGEQYWKAYEKYKLHEISKEGWKRLLR